jgi:uncharacterized membrane protein YgaE (UPF0421/DUF939 family)
MKILHFIDPAYLNLKNACRGTLAVIFAFIICTKLSPLMGFLAGILALLSSILVGDIHRKSQMLTIGAMIPVALISLTTSVLLSGYHNVQLFIFSMFTFMAIFIRKYGIRWLAIGIVSFMSYFLPLFFPLKPIHLPIIYITVVVAIACSFVFRFYLFPEKTEVVLRSYIKSWNALYFRLAKSLQDKVEPSFKELNELTLLIENHCNNFESHKVHSRTEALQMIIFEREMDLQFNKHAADTPIVMDELTETEIRKEVITEALEETAPAPGINATTKLAIQATIAVSIASYLGILISPERWYWAPMAAFVILTGTSRGETVLRASTRILGTTIGLVSGILLAPALAGHADLEWAVVILCVFMGIFSSKFTFGFWSASWFTFMLTVFFNLMGQFTNQVLILRFEETLLGAVIGAIVSALVLPTSTTKAIKIAIEKTLKTQANVLSFLPLNVTDKDEKRNLVRAIRKMDQEFSSLRLIAKPYTEGYSLIKRKKMVTLIHHTTFLNHYVKKLATIKNPRNPNVEEGLLKTRSYLLQIADNLDFYLENEQFISELGNITKFMGP